MPSLKEISPYGAYLEQLKLGHLAFQVTPDGQAVFFPRVAAPGTGDPLEWRLSKGQGTVYAVTVLYPRDLPAYNVVLVEMDEGFRLMSTVIGVDPDSVRIGQKVQAEIEEREGADPRPVFRLADGAAS